MWECFSFYGMRVLLVLYMVHELGYSDEKAFGMYALYITLVELGGVFGGIAADRFLGLKRAIVMGGITIALGHIAMALGDLFLLGLGLIISGTTLFRSNITALLGQFYEENDPRRDSGYTLFYTGINIGGFLASLLCGYVGEVYGWHYGFGLAAIGMLSGLIVLFFGRGILGTKGEPIRKYRGATKLGSAGLLCLAPACALMLLYYDTATPLIPVVGALIVYIMYTRVKEFANYKRLGLYLILLVLFYGCEEQLGSTLVLFGERHVDRATFFGTIPAASLITCNPLTILVFGPFVSRLLQRVHLQGVTKIAIAFGLLASAFCMLYAGCYFATDEKVVALELALLSILLISLGELFIGPTVFATASEVAPAGLAGLTMGAVSLGYSLASLFSGLLSKMMIVQEGDQSLAVYMRGFMAIALIALFIALVLTNTRKKEVTT